jgi:hypothetical protein
LETVSSRVRPSVDDNHLWTYRFEVCDLCPWREYRLGDRDERPPRHKATTVAATIRFTSICPTWPRWGFGTDTFGFKIWDDSMASSEANVTPTGEPIFNFEGPLTTGDIQLLDLKFTKKEVCRLLGEKSQIHGLVDPIQAARRAGDDSPAHLCGRPLCALRRRGAGRRRRRRPRRDPGQRRPSRLHGFNLQADAVRHGAA